MGNCFLYKRGGGFGGAIPDIVKVALGKIISLSDSKNAKLKGLRVFGKTIQNGTPTPENPVELVSTGDGGSVTVYIGISESDTNPQTLSVSTPNGLPGIPVSSGGNYTDENGQQWVCDEVDFARGKYVQRVNRIPLDAEIFNRIDSGGFAPYGITWTTRMVSGRSTITITGFPSIAERTQTGQAGTVMMCSFTNIIGAFTSGKCVMWENGSKGNDQCNVAFNTEYVAEASKEAFIQFFSANPGEILMGSPEPIEHPLSAEQLAAYAALHTNYPSTTIYNDAGADMEVKYTAIGG